MLKCPECGEQIAEIDVFCAYCGISLTSVQKLDEDLSMSETIVGNSIDFTKDYKPAEPTPNELSAVQAEEKIVGKTAESTVSSTESESEPAAIPPPSPFDFEPLSTEKPFSQAESAADFSNNLEAVDIPIQIIEEKPPVVWAGEENSSPVMASDLSPSMPVSEKVQEPVADPIEPKPEIDLQGENEVKSNSPDSFMADIPVPLVIQELEAEQQTSLADDKADESPIATVDETESSKFSEDVFSKSPENLTETPAQNFEFTEVETEKSVSPVAENPVLPKFEENDDWQIPTPPPSETPFDFDDASPKSDSDAVFESKPDPLPLDFADAASANLDLIDAKTDLNNDANSADFAKIAPAETEEPQSDLSPIAPFVEKADADRFGVENSPVLSAPNVMAEESKQEFPKAPDALPDQDNIETLEDSAPVMAGSAVEEKPSEQERPFTQPNIGQGDTDGRKSAKLKPLDEGTLLNNRYEIVRKIGGGGMGAVYLAYDRNLGGITRAVKEMVQSYIELEQQDKAVADFQREAMILTGLDHTAIPTIFDYFFDEKEGRFYLVMKYISGGDLAARLRAAPEGRLDEKTVTEWAIQVADVLEYLHRQEPVIVYRDLKPANIMIDGNTGRIMLIDFGIARSINKEEKGVTAVGTMGYAPPELFSGNVEPRSDIYSLGSTMFHLLTGADPQSNPLLIFDFQKNPRPRQINSQLSDQMEQILMRSVEYNAELRFTSAAEMRSALQDHLTNLQAGKVSFGVKAAPSAVGFSEQPVFCGFCGKQIVASDVFCAFCGSQQPIAQQSFHSAPALAVSSAMPTAKLFVVLTNDLEASGFNLEKTENLIGRRDPMSNIFPEVDLSKYDPQTKISRRHARIWRDGNMFMLEDLGSSNGTILHAGSTDSVRLLPRQPRPLTNGDKFKVGDTTLQFTIS